MLNKFYLWKLNRYHPSKGKFHEMKFTKYYSNFKFHLQILSIFSKNMYLPTKFYTFAIRVQNWANFIPTPIWLSEKHQVMHIEPALTCSESYACTRSATKWKIILLVSAFYISAVKSSMSPTQIWQFFTYHSCAKLRRTSITTKPLVLNSGAKSN